MDITLTLQININQVAYNKHIRIARLLLLYIWKNKNLYENVRWFPTIRETCYKMD